MPSTEEIDFTLQIFREVVEPVLETLEGLIGSGKCILELSLTVTNHEQRLLATQYGVMTSAGRLLSFEAAVVC